MPSPLRGPSAKTLYDIKHGARLDTHHEILALSQDELRERHPWTKGLRFNERMLRGEFDESCVPDDSCLFGTAPRGAKRWVIGNEQGEILPAYLHAAWCMIEARKERGDAHSEPEHVMANDAQRQKLYAIIREAQLRALPPFDTSRNEPVSWAVSAKQRKPSVQMNVDEDHDA